MKIIKIILYRLLSYLNFKVTAVALPELKHVLLKFIFAYCLLNAPNAAAVENIVVSASADLSSGIGPHMQLWVQGVKVGEADVTQTTATNFTFPVTLSLNGTVSIDVVFTNDGCCFGGDRNLYVHSVSVKGQTLLPTDVGVIIDRGSGSAAFDGVDTVAGQVGLWWAGATRFTVMLSPALIASYGMDGIGWNGTSNELSDNAGYAGGPYNGQAIGSPKPVASTVSPTPPNTCGYATFNSRNGSAFTLDNLPVSTETGAKTSVSFWMYWDGTNSVMPLGWNRYDLWFVSGAFGFNTFASDVYGMNSAGLANGWHHVVAVFTNGSVTSNKIYIDGISQALSQKFGSPYSGGAYVGSTLQVSGAGISSSYRFSGGRIDEVKIYNGEVTQAQVDADYVASCNGLNITPANFNCVVPLSNANTGHLYAQVVGSNFNVDIVALKSDGFLEQDYVLNESKEVLFEFVDGAGSVACSSRGAVSPAVVSTITFSPEDLGRKTVSVKINKAYRNLRCRITDTNQSPSVVGCSSDNFSVRPGSFTVSAGGGVNADGAGLSETATPTAKAGSSFALNAVTNAVGYDGSPNINTAKLSAHIGASQTGTLSGVFGAATASNGTATGVAFAYDEVGYFRLGSYGVYDSTFTAVDAANGDCAVGFSASGGKHACSFGNVSATSYFGRFIPDHFSINAGTTTPACNTGFTYYGQDGFTTPFTITAQNAANTTTQNYTGSFAKLNLTAWNDYRFTAATLPAGSLLSVSSTLPTGTWGNGVANVLASHQISRPTSPAPVMGIVISAAPVDVDGVTMPSAAVANQSDFRYGRLSIANAYGSELLPLTQMVEAKYWNGVTYVRNQLDSCTAIETSSIAMTNYKSNLSACETSVVGGGVMDGGKVDIKLTAPGNGNNGGVDLSVNLNGASGTTCTPNSAIATSADMPWFGANPSAHATFGLYKSPVLYMRENF